MCAEKCSAKVFAPSFDCGMRHAACTVELFALCCIVCQQCVPVCGIVCQQCVAVCASSVWPDIFCNIMRRAVLLLTSECWPMSRRWNSGHRVCQYGGEGTLALIWTAAKTYQPSLNLRLKSLGLLPRKSIPIQKGANFKTCPTKLL